MHHEDLFREQAVQSQILAAVQIQAGSQNVFKKKQLDLSAVLKHHHVLLQRQKRKNRCFKKLIKKYHQVINHSTVQQSTIFDAVNVKSKKE